MQPPPPRYQRKGLVDPRQRGRKGFGLADWVNLTKVAKDLAQRKGAPLRRITKEEIREHSTVHDGWCSLKGKVYNISPYLAYHPGGEKIMKGVLGKDATALFDKYHPWVNVDGLIGTLQLGYLATSTSAKSEDEPASYMSRATKQDEFAVPAPVVTKTKARNMENIMPKADDRDEDQIEEDYKEPWEE